MGELLTPIRPVRVFGDINNTLYRFSGGENRILNTQSPISEGDLTDISDIHHSIDDQRTEISSDGDIKKGRVSHGEFDLKFRYYQDQFSGYVIDPLERAGLRRLSETIDVTGDTPKVTLLSNMPVESKSFLMRRLASDRVIDYLDPRLPVLLRPNRNIHPAAFKREVIRFFTACGEDVYVIDDDFYIGDCLRRELGVKVYNPLSPVVVSKQPLAKSADLFGSGISYMSGSAQLFVDLLQRGSLKIKS